MSNLRQAAQQALEVLENSRSLEPVDVDWVKGKRKAVIAALRDALAEPNKCTHGVTDGNCKECYMAESEQEPVAWMDREGDLYKMPEIKNWAPPHKMLYTAPPQRKPLSEEEIWQIVTNCTIGSDLHADKLARAIEAAHGIKTAQ